MFVGEQSYEADVWTVTSCFFNQIYYSVCIYILKTAAFRSMREIIKNTLLFTFVQI